MNAASTYKQLIDEAIAGFVNANPERPEGLYEPVNYTLSLGGKRMRPLLVLIACDMFGGKVEDALPAALAVELFHNFTLVHDDIMDNASLRRGQPTVHEKWDRNTAVLSGDVMLVAAYRELAKCRPEKLPGLMRIFSRMAAEVCEGQQLDMDFELEKEVGIDRYLEMIELKTAVLLGACLEMGALIAGADELACELLRRIGVGLGVAFQLQDDALDVFGDEKTFGKKKGGDIIANKKTFLLIKALELSSPEQKQELQKWMHGQNADASKKIDAVCAIYQALNIEEHATHAFTHHFQTASSLLQVLQTGQGKKDTLNQLILELFERKH